MVVAGEIYPYDGSLLDSRLGVLYKTANPQYEKYSKVLNFLGTKFKGASWSWNVNLSQAARVNLLTGQIEFNPYMMQDDTPWHEFGHFTVRAIKDKNPELFNELKEEVKKLHEEDPANSAFSYVRELYPEYGLTEAFWEEAITTSTFVIPISHYRVNQPPSSGQLLSADAVSHPFLECRQSTLSYTDAVDRSKPFQQRPPLQFPPDTLPSPCLQIL